VVYMASAEREPIVRVWEQSPLWGKAPSGAKPLEAGGILISDAKQD